MRRSQTQFSQMFVFLILAALDIVALAISLLVAGLIVKFFSLDGCGFSKEFMIDYFWIIWIVFFLFLYEKINIKRFDFWEEINRIFKALLYSFATVLIFITLSNQADDYSRFVIVLFFVVSSIMVPTTKRVGKALLFKARIFKLRIKILADESSFHKIKKEFEKNWYLGYEIVQKRYDIVFICSKKYPIEKLQKVIEKYSHFTKDVYIVPYIKEIDFSSSEVVNYSNINLAVFHVENRLLNKKNTIVKFIIERILTLMILPLFFILHIFISIAIKLDSKGSVIFKQKRFGKDSKLYYCYKYRTMYENSDSLLKEYLEKNLQEIEHYARYHKYKNDPRVTRVGKFLRKTSLDELPQFINILKSEMNLIGPRPYMYEESLKIPPSSKNIIFKVRPGITGLWQVQGRNELPFEERIKLDVWYINNWSLWRDFVIFLKTIKVVLVQRGVS